MPQATAHSPLLAAATLCVCAYFYPRICCGKGFSLCPEVLETAGSSEQTEICETEQGFGEKTFSHQMLK